MSNKTEATDNAGKPSELSEQDLDTMQGGQGIEKKRKGKSSLLGGPGNDSLIGGLGNDSLIGGPGNDSLVGV